MEVESLAEQLFYTTVRIEAESDSGTQFVGTSFVFTYENQGIAYQFLVTNKHVVEGSTIGRLTFIASADDKPNLGSGHTITITGFSELWHGHPSESIDVTVAPLGRAIKLLEEQELVSFFRSIGNEIVLTPDIIQGLDALEEIIFVGYPSGIWDRKNLLPVARKGITATPLSVDFNGEKKFLVDAAVFPGSSGSPVFLYNAGMFYDKKGTTHVGTRLIFLGIISEVYYRTDKQILVPLPEMTSTAEPHSIQMINLGVVYKASTVVETIETYLKKEEVVLEGDKGAHIGQD